MVWEIHTYGGGEFLIHLLAGVKMIFGSDAYTTLIRIMGVAGLLCTAIFVLFSQKVQFLFTWFLAFSFVYLGMFVPKYDVAIVDHLQPASNQVITNVPAALAIFGHASTMIGEGLTRLAETAYALPPEIGFRTSGYGASVHAAHASFSEEIPEPYVHASTAEYIKNCVFYDVLDGTKSADGILKSTNLLADIRVDHNSRFTETLIRPDGGRVSGTPEVVTCTVAYDRVVAGLNRIYENWWNRFVETVSGSQRIPPELVASLLPVSYDRLMSIAASPQEILFQNGIIHSYDRALQAFAETTGADSQLLGMALSHAEYQQKVGAFTAGQRAKQILPAIRIVAEAMIFGIFPFIFLFAFTPLVARVLQVYITGLIWLQLWGPLLAILNLVTVILTEQAIAPRAIDGLTITTIGGLQAGLSDKLSIAAWAAATVPLVAWGVASYSFSGIVNTVGALIGSTQSTAQHTAGGTGMGNVSTGNVSMNTISANKTNTTVESSTGWKVSAFGGSVDGGATPAAYHYATMGVASHLDSPDMGSLTTFQTSQQAHQEIEASRNQMVQRAHEAFNQQVASISDGLRSMSGSETKASSDNGVTRSVETGLSSDSSRTAAMVQSYADRIQSTYGFSAEESKDIAVRALAAKSLDLTGSLGGEVAGNIALGQGKSQTGSAPQVLGGASQQNPPLPGSPGRLKIGSGAEVGVGGRLQGQKEDRESASLDAKRKEAFDSVFNSATEEQARDSWSLFERAVISDQARHGHSLGSSSGETSSAVRSEESQGMEGLRGMASEIGSLSKRMAQGEGKTVIVGSNQMPAMMHYISGRTGLSVSQLNSMVGHDASYHFGSGNYDVRDIPIAGKKLSEWAGEMYESMDPRSSGISAEFDQTQTGVTKEIQRGAQSVSEQRGQIGLRSQGLRDHVRSEMEKEQAEVSGEGDRIVGEAAHRQGSVRDQIDSTQGHVSDTSNAVRESGNNLESRVKDFQNEGVSLGRAAGRGSKDLNPYRNASDNAISENRDRILPPKPTVRTHREGPSQSGADVYLGITRSSAGEGLSLQGVNPPHPNFYPESRAQALEKMNRESKEGLGKENHYNEEFRKNIENVYRTAKKLETRSQKEDSE